MTSKLIQNLQIFFVQSYKFSLIQVKCEFIKIASQDASDS